jgi:predicted transcriptional regulator
MMTFSQLLVRSGLRKVDLAETLGVSAGTVSRWRDEKVPRYVIAYLDLLVRWMGRP